MSIKLKVLLQNFSCTDLPAMDNSGFSDPYIVGNFDSFREFKTDVIKETCNPVWENFETSFIYTTQYKKKLKKKVFSIKVYDKDKLGKSDFIGSLTVNLHSLATGCQKHDLQLWDGDKPRGRVQFEAIVDELASIKVYLKNVKITNLRNSGDGALKPYLKYHYTGNDNIQAKTPINRSKNHSSPEWKVLEILHIITTLKDLMRHNLRIDILSKQRGEDALCGYIQLSFHKHHTFEEGEEVSFEEIVDNTAGDIGIYGPTKISGSMYFKGFPHYTQMVGGIRSDNGISGANIFMRGVKKTKVRVIDNKKSKKEQKESQQDLQDSVKNQFGGLKYNPFNNTNNTALHYINSQKTQQNQTQIAQQQLAQQKLEQQKLVQQQLEQQKLAHQIEQRKLEQERQTLKLAQQKRELELANQRRMLEQQKLEQQRQAEELARKKRELEQQNQTGQVNPNMNHMMNTMQGMMSQMQGMMQQNQQVGINKPIINKPIVKKKPVGNVNMSNNLMESLAQNRNNMSSIVGMNMGKPQNNASYNMSNLMGGMAAMNMKKDVKKGLVKKEPVQEKNPFGFEPQEGMPYGWEKCFHESSNRYFYKNHVTKSTQWNPPTQDDSAKAIIAEKQAKQNVRKASNIFQAKTAFGKQLGGTPGVKQQPTDYAERIKQQMAMLGLNQDNK